MAAALVTAVAVGSGALALIWYTPAGSRPPGIRRAASPAAGRSPAQPPAEVAIESRQSIGYPESGGATWLTFRDPSPVAGTGGRVVRFATAVERDLTGISPAEFGAAVFSILADPRGWTGGGQLRLQRVGPETSHDFTVYLATPATRDALCGDGYDRYTSCRSGDRVVVNVARWANAVPPYLAGPGGAGAGLESYRQYVVNHEVGHWLGYGHQLCPGPDRPAPVMQQQTLGLHGCHPNPWSYLDGAWYAGPGGEYSDPLPS